MEIDQAIEMIKSHLTEERYNHSLRVADVAVELAKYNHICTEKMNLAGVLHDYAKHRSLEEMKRWIKTSALPRDLLLYNSAIWHGPVGALMLQFEHGIYDREILNAIRYHPTGRPHMSRFEKILFVADYIEPERDIPGIEQVRNIAYQNINEATLLILKNMIQFLQSKNQMIYPDTFYAYNTFIHHHKSMEGF